MVGERDVNFFGLAPAVPNWKLPNYRNPVVFDDSRFNQGIFDCSRDVI